MLAQTLPALCSVGSACNGSVLNEGPRFDSSEAPHHWDRSYSWNLVAYVNKLQRVLLASKAKQLAGESKWCWQCELLMRMPLRRSVSKPKWFRNVLSWMAAGFKYCRKVAETDLQMLRHSAITGVHCKGKRSATRIKVGWRYFFLTWRRLGIIPEM